MARNPPRIVVVGSANVDLTSFTERFPHAGETIFGDDFHLGFGGKGANQAVAAAHCGAEVEMVARLGDDLFGPATLDNFKELGVGTQHVKTVAGAASGVAPIFVDSTGENRIIVVKGANDLVTPEVVDAARDIIKAADIVILQLEIPLETVYHTLRLAAEHGVQTIFNPAPAAEIDLEILSSVSYFVPNETEASAITGLPVETIPEAEACAAHLLEKGAHRVILTLGERGALVAGPDGTYQVPAVSVKPKDTSGAGDAFIGSFAVFLSQGFAERDAVARANLYAALSTTRVGTQTSFPTREMFECAWQKHRS